MTVNRRDLLIGSLPLAVGASLPQNQVAQAAQPIKQVALNFQETGLVPNSSKDQTKRLQAAIDLAAQRKEKLVLPGGTFKTGPLTLRSGTQIEGLYGETVLKFISGSSFISANKITSATLRFITFDGASIGFIQGGVDAFSGDLAVFHGSDRQIFAA